LLFLTVPIRRRPPRLEFSFSLARLRCYSLILLGKSLRSTKDGSPTPLPTSFNWAQSPAKRSKCPRRPAFGSLGRRTREDSAR